MRAFSLDSELLQSQYFFTFFFLITFFDPERTKKISYLMSKIAEINWHCVLKVSFHEKNGIVKKCKFQAGKMSYKPISKVQTEVDLAKQKEND